MMLRLFTLIFCLFAFSGPALAFGTAAKQAIVIDYDTGQILYEKNADERMPTSSMSKVMTIYMVFDALKNGEISLDTTFRVSEKAWRKGGSKMFVEAGERVAVEDLLRGVIVQSGNDATIVLAEGLRQREEDFARLMTEKAQELGMNASNFVNASGWPDDNHYSTARDLATLAQALIRDFPQYFKYYSETEYTHNDITQPNRNPLLYQNIRADGIKTGHTNIAGFGLIGTGTALDGRRVIFVLNGLDSEADRAQESKRILEWAYDHFEQRALIAAGQELATIEVSLGAEENIRAVAGQNANLIVPRQEDNTVIEAHYLEPLIAPIEEGQEIGALHIKTAYEEYHVPLVAAQAVPKAGVFDMFVQKLTLLISGA